MTKKRSLYGIDIGTGNIVCAKNVGPNRFEVRRIRNSFLSLGKDVVASSELKETTLDYLELYEADGSLQTVVVVGEDAFKFANIFGKKVRRPMRYGLINPSEIDSIEIIGHMIKLLLDKEDEERHCVFSVPAQPIDNNDVPLVSYHENVFKNVFRGLGFSSCRSLSEAVAVVYSNCRDTKLSGIGISIGAGLTNIACVYKGVSAINFSLSIGGDWIDESVSLSTGKLVNRITLLKERSFSLENEEMNKAGTKEEQRIKMALYNFYVELIDRILRSMSEEFNKRLESLMVEEEMPIVLAGGTSMVKGFVNLFKEIFDTKYKSSFPYKISAIRLSNAPLEDIAIGCGIYLCNTLE